METQEEKLIGELQKTMVKKQRAIRHLKSLSPALKDGMEPRHAYKEVEAMKSRRAVSRKPYFDGGKGLGSTVGSFSLGYNTQTAGFSKDAGSSTGFQTFTSGFNLTRADQLAAYMVKNE